MTAPTTPNAELAWRVMDYIDAHPEQHNQLKWWCGTSGCFAGWTVTLAGITIPMDADGDWEMIPYGGDGEMLTISDLARDLLRIGPADCDSDGDPHLFGASYSRHKLRAMVAVIFGPRPEPADGQPVTRTDRGHAREHTRRPADDDIPPNAGSAG